MFIAKLIFEISIKCKLGFDFLPANFHRIAFESNNNALFFKYL
jgi:hypothetical protein